MSTKYPRSYHLKYSPGTTSDDRICHSQSNLIGKRLVISEKLDGENNSLCTGGVYARSHGTYTTNPWAVKTWELHERIKNSLWDDVYLFGESMYAIHSIEYSNLKSFFYLFGVREGDRWYSWEEVEEISFLLDIPTVPVLYDGVFNSEKELEDKVMELISGPSILGAEQKEGIVVRLYDSFNDVDFGVSLNKWVRKNHIQTDAHWTRSWKKAYISYE